MLVATRPFRAPLSLFGGVLQVDLSGCFDLRGDLGAAGLPLAKTCPALAAVGLRQCGRLTVELACLKGLKLEVGGGGGGWYGGAAPGGKPQKKK